MDNPANDNPQPYITKGEIKVDISAFVFNPNLTELEKSEGTGEGNYFAAEPILYSITIPAFGEIPKEELFSLPEKMAREVITAIAHACHLIRISDNSVKILEVGKRPDGLTETPQFKLLDHTGKTIN